MEDEVKKVYPNSKIMMMVIKVRIKKKKWEDNDEGKYNTCQ